MDSQTLCSLARQILSKRASECYDTEYLLDVIQVWDMSRIKDAKGLAHKYASALFDHPGAWEDHILKSRNDYLAWDGLQILRNRPRAGFLRRRQGQTKATHARLAPNHRSQ